VNLFTQLALQVAGGAAASYADREWGPAHNQHFDIGTTRIEITVGAMGAIAGALLLALGVPLPGRVVLANLVGGALVYEGTKLAETKLLPLLEGTTAPQPPVLNAPAVQGYGAFGYGNPYPSYAVQGVPSVPDMSHEIALQHALAMRGGFRATA
jgi:hypothetical protein